MSIEQRHLERGARFTRWLIVTASFGAALFAVHKLSVIVFVALGATRILADRSEFADDVRRVYRRLRATA